MTNGHKSLLVLILTCSSSFRFRHDRVCLPGSLHLRDVPPDVGHGSEDLLRVELQPLRQPRHLRLRLRGRLDSLQAESGLFRPLRSQGSQATQDLQSHSVRSEVKTKAEQQTFDAPILFQVLVFTAELGDITAELDEVHHLTATAPLPVHFDLCPPWDATFRRNVQFPRRNAALQLQLLLHRHVDCVPSEKQ